VSAGLQSNRHIVANRKGNLLVSIFGLALMSFNYGCEAAPPKKTIRVKNDTLDSEYNQIRITGGGVNKLLSPGESVDLPGGIKSFSLSRSYANYTRRYRVECPVIKNGIVIKMIDVHLNKIAGGCSTVSATKG
jgi:hypothetical protein